MFKLLNSSTICNSSGFSKSKANATVFQVAFWLFWPQTWEKRNSSLLLTIFWTALDTTSTFRVSNYCPLFSRNFSSVKWKWHIFGVFCRWFFFYRTVKFLIVFTLVFNKIYFTVSWRYFCLAFKKFIPMLFKTVNFLKYA